MRESLAFGKGGTLFCRGAGRIGGLGKGAESAVKVPHLGGAHGGGAGPGVARGAPGASQRGQVLPGRRDHPGDLGRWVTPGASRCLSSEVGTVVHRAPARVQPGAPARVQPGDGRA